MNKSLSIVASIYRKSIGRFFGCYRLCRLDLSEFSEKTINYKIDHFSFFMPGKKEINLFKRLYGDNKNKFEIAEKRLEANNYLCFAYGDDNNGRIAYARWLCTKRYQANTIRKEFIFKDNEAMTVDSYTHPDYRLRGLHKNMNACMLHWIKVNAEIRYVYAVYACFAIHISKILYQLGYKPVERAFYYKKGSFKNFIKSLFL